MDVISLTADDLELTAATSSVHVSLAPPRAITLKVPKAAIHVQSYAFSETPAAEARPPALSKKPPRTAPDPPPSFAGGNHTRLRPPRDIVKLADRLYYLLQPPLDTLH